jgi:predicted small secreted protein
MKTILKAAMIVALVGAGAACVGCNTWNGAGKDVQKTGEHMQGK